MGRRFRFTAARRAAIAGALVAAVACAGTACANLPDKSANKNTSQSYARDGYMGLTNTNPSVPLTPTSLNNAADGAMIRNVLAGYEDVVNSTVQLQGGTARVWVTLSDRLNNAEKRTMLVDIYRKLTHMMPRYTVKVIPNNAG